MKKPPNSQPVFGESGIGCTFTNTGNGISVNLNQPVQLFKRAPLTVYLGTQNQVQKILVQPGLVNGFIPKISGTDLDQLPAPSLNASAGVVYVRVQRVANSPFPANVTIQKAASVPSDDTDFGHYALASVTADDKGNLSVFNYVEGNLQCHRLAVTSAPFLYYWAVV